MASWVCSFIHAIQFHLYSSVVGIVSLICVIHSCSFSYLPTNIIGHVSFGGSRSLMRPRCPLSAPAAMNQLSSKL
jgi:hypothetical protein